MSADDHKQALPPGFTLGSYRIERVLGVGGFGVTYLCEHGGLGVQVAVKEYLPNEVAVRDGTDVHPKSARDREGFEWGLERFLDEARTVARYRHPNVVRVRDCFEANRTAYIVMDYEDGEPLDALLRRHGTLTEAQLRRIALPLADGLREVHAAGFLHRDVKPANVFVRRSDETPVLLDFGSARQALGHRSRSVTAIASAGYSPPEQYERDGEQGPWTDIYALSALCYRAITGKAPVEAPRRQGEMLRSRSDPLPSLAEAGVPGYSQGFLDAVDWGLCLVEVQRPQVLNQWLERIGDTPAISWEEQATTPRLSTPTESQLLVLSRSSVSSAMARLWQGIQNVFGTRPRNDLGPTRSSPHEQLAQAAVQATSRRLGPRGYLHDVLTGSLGLRTMFWAIGVAGNVVASFCFAFIFGFSTRNNEAWILALIAPSSTVMVLYEGYVRYISREAILAALILWLLWSLLAKIGIWRAASIYSGPPRWAVMAKLHTAVDTFAAALILSSV